MTTCVTCVPSGNMAVIALKTLARNHPCTSAFSRLHQLNRYTHHLPVTSSSGGDQHIHRNAGNMVLLKAQARSIFSTAGKTVRLTYPQTNLPSPLVASLRHSRNLSTSRQMCSKGDQPEPMPQVGSPDVDVFQEQLLDPPSTFKGLETEFPCLARVKDTGPEPAYQNVTTGYKIFRCETPFRLRLNKGVLPQLDVAYETWGELNKDRSNAIVILAGMSASSHARSSVDNMRPGWWERFVGPGCAVDSNKFFVICPNNFGGCYGSSGPSSINELTGNPYGTTFPIITIEDMTNAIFLLLDHLGIDKSPHKNADIEPHEDLLTTVKKFLLSVPVTT